MCRGIHICGDIPAGAGGRALREGAAQAPFQRKECECPGTISGLGCVFLIRKITTLLTFLFWSCSVLGNGSRNKQHPSPGWSANDGCWEIFCFVTAVSASRAHENIFSGTWRMLFLNCSPPYLWCLEGRWASSNTLQQCALFNPLCARWRGVQRSPSAGWVVGCPL